MGRLERGFGDEEKPKLTIEDYLRFVEKPDARGLSLHQLNQIVLMHGFLRLKTKKPIVEALRPILMRPKRSTLKNRETYPCAALTLDEVRSDIASIGWQECPIGSVTAVTVGSPGSAGDEEAANPASISVTDLICLATIRRAIASRKRKRRNSAASISASDLICPATTSNADAGKKKRRRRNTAACISAICPATTSSAVAGKKKRKRRTTAGASATRPPGF